MRIGYACITIGVANTQIKGCILKNATNDRLMDLIHYNLNSLENIIEYNVQQQINLFRISSDLIPFGSNDINTLPWQDLYQATLKAIGKKIISNHIRVSMHPGQYTVLNSPNAAVVEKAIKDLHYHCRVLDSLGMNSEHKIILHIGGVYQNKKEAIERFILHFGYLDLRIKQRLVIENDDRLFHIDDLLTIGTRLNIPVVFDNLHNAINPYDSQIEDKVWISKCKKTWGIKDGIQKIHYAQQNLQKNPGAHSETIEVNEFLEFYKKLDRKDIDIMLEVKDKNLSAIKCINSICTLD